MVAINSGYLLGFEVGGYVGEVSTPDIIAPLDNVLENILHVAEVARGDALAADFVKRLTAGSNVLLDAGIAIPCKHPGYIACVGDSETIRQWLFAHLARLIAVPIANRRPNHLAVLANNLKHSGFAGSDVAPQPQPLVRVIIAVKHQTPTHKVVEQRLHGFGDLEKGTNRLTYSQEVKFFLRCYVS